MVICCVVFAVCVVLCCLVFVVGSVVFVDCCVFDVV